MSCGGGRLLARWAKNCSSDTLDMGEKEVRLSNDIALGVLRELRGSPNGMSVAQLAERVHADSLELEKGLMAYGRVLGLGLRKGVWYADINDGWKPVDRC